MNKLRITPEAARDLLAIKTYISDELGNPVSAARVVARITKELRILQSHAEAGPSIEAKTGYETDLRMLVCGNYIALCRAEQDTVSVARVINAKQDYMRVLFGENME